MLTEDIADATGLPPEVIRAVRDVGIDNICELTKRFLDGQLTEAEKKKITRAIMAAVAAHLVREMLREALNDEEPLDNTHPSGDPDPQESAPKSSKQMKKLSKGEIKKLKELGIDPHDLKPNSKYDLFKDTDGNIHVKPKDGSGPGDPTGINVNDQ
jgi:hypothetical protein